MADGDRAAVRIDARVLEVDAHQLEAAEHLAGEGLVDLDDVHVPERQPGALEGARNGVRRPDAHDARLDAGAGRREDASGRLFAALFTPLFAADNQSRSAVIDA